MNFNPPPGWPVPPGWEPPAGWVPDPAWPPAPPGWQFWDAGPSPTELSPPAKTRRSLPGFVVIATVVAVFAGLVGGGYLLVQHWTADDAGAPVAGQLRGTFPDQPSAGWRLNAGEVFDRAQFVRPDPTSYQYQRAGFLDFGDTLVAAAVLPNTDRSATLVGIDAGSGALKWKAEAGFSPACATATFDGLLPCVGHEPSWGVGPSTTSVFFVRMSDGSIAHQLTVADQTRSVEVHDSAVYTMRYVSDSSTRIITRGTVDDLTADWEQRYPLDDSDAGCPGSGDSLYDGVAGSLVYSGSDLGVVVADTADGRQVLPAQLSDLEVYPGQGFTARDCAGAYSDAVSTVVLDSDGTPLRSVQSQFDPATPQLVSATGELPYIIDRTAYDFVDGEQLWTAAGDAQLHTIIGDTVLGGGNDQNPVAGYDLATGEQLWTSDVVAWDFHLSDGRHAMTQTSDGLTAIDLATGKRVWTLPGIDGWRSVAPAGDGFAYITRDVITYYPPTGGPSVAPGRGAVIEPSTDDAGLVTKCGRTPEMTPVKYRAEGGALVVTMQLRARCPGGDVISTDRLRVTISDELGRICSAVFDFSADPLVLSGDEVSTFEFVFTDGSFTRHPNSLGGSDGSNSTGIVTETDASGRETVDCVDEGTSTDPQRTDRRSGDGGSISGEPSTGGPDCGSEDDALASLRAQVNADRPFVESRLAERWVAQLSSKQPGLVAPDVDGRVLTWGPCEILQQHLRLRGQYPEVRLVWSNEWRTFDLAGWWVTFAGETFPGPDAANGWCDARSIPVDECYAKVVSNTRDSRGSTKYRR